MADFSLLLSDVEPVAQTRCVQCKKVYGRERPEFARALRCPNCDFPFGTDAASIRAIALSLQDLAPRSQNLVNVYSQNVCYIWLHLARDLTDLSVEPYEDIDMFGPIPEWLVHETDNSSWSDIVQANWIPFQHGNDFSGTWNQWGLEEGLAPGQPFLIEFFPPRWYRCSYEYEEYDVEYSYDIAMRVPRSSLQAARAWEQWQKTCARNRRGIAAAAAAKRHKAERDISAMYIRFDSFWVDRYSEMTPPDGRIIRLCSSHGGELAAGRSPRNWREGSRSDDDAWDDLAKNIRERLPHLDFDTNALQKLPRRF